MYVEITALPFPLYSVKNGAFKLVTRRVSTTTTKVTTPTVTSPTTTTTTGHTTTSTLVTEANSDGE